jgi:acyl-CoA synthetase (AMP-forming)/AMP-acid ligase II
MSSDPQTIPAALDRIARQLPHHPALVTPDRTLTFAALRADVRRAAAAMVKLGINAGERVAIWSPNTWHWVVACLATHYAGATVVPVNTRYTVTEATGILARTGAPLLVAMDEFLGVDKVADVDRSALPDLRHVVRVPLEKAGRDDDTDDIPWAEFVAEGVATGAADARAAAVRPDDISDILFTSGTTGRSKGVLGAHRQSLAGSAAWAKSPATIVTCASTRSSITSVTRPASWPVCKPAPP